MLGEPAAPSSARGGGGGGGPAGFAQAVAEIEARTRALDMEAAALLSAAVGGREFGDAAQYARERARLMTEALNEGREITPELEAQIDALSAAYVTAGESAQEAAQRIDEVRANAERGADAVTDIFMAMAQGGDAARQAVARLLMELARVQASRAFQSLAGGSGGGGSLFGFLGGLLGRKRAAGGPVSAGVPYLVNENTPNSEVFVPSQSGAVLNVPQAQAAMRGQGGGGVVNNFHIDARGAVEGTDAKIANALQAFIPQVSRIAVVAVGDARSRGR
jgi:hypothetical protein